MKEKLKSIKNSYLTYAILFVIILILIGITASYASFKVNKANSSTPSNIGVSLECMNIAYSETDTIDLDYNYPISDDYALEKIKPVTVTVTNNCSQKNSNVNYTLAISSLSNNTGYIEDNQIKIKVNRTMPNESENVIRTPMYLDMLDEMPEGNALISLQQDLKSRSNIGTYQNSFSYIIDSNTVSTGETITYKVYLWVDYYEGDKTRTGLRDNSTEGKNFDAAISIITNDDLHKLELGEAYAIYTESDSTLRFVRSTTPYVVGDTYNEAEITEVYTGFEEETYNSNSVPWVNEDIRIVTFEDEIIPISTAWWFNHAEILEIDATKLNTSNVNDMSGMFSWVYTDIIGLESWDTSNVINMSDMFGQAIVPESISNWDVSNVTDMSDMFTSATINTDLDLSGWNTSNVTDMSDMFSNATINTVLDLSGWNVDNVENYDRFNYGVSGSGTLTPPKW